MTILERVYEENDFISSLGEPKFRLAQIKQMLLDGVSLEDNTTLPKSLKEKLQQSDLLPLEIYQFKKGKSASKFLYKLLDGNLIEGILMEHSYGNTLCVSTQVGCRMGCKFCASTLDGLVRNLSPYEILCQYIVANKFAGGTQKNRAITNIVLMGSGEPLDNYDNTLKFLNLITSEETFNISRRNISLSTCGLCDKIDKLADDFPNLVLTISLHAPTDKQRKQTMPIANKYSLNDIMNSARRYYEKTKRRVVFEYALIKDQNDRKEDAENLKKLMHGLSYHINLIPLNYVKERENLKPTDNAVRFLKWCEELGMSATIRKSLGSDIDGACGQLRRKVLQQKGEE